MALTGGSIMQHVTQKIVRRSAVREIGHCPSYPLTVSLSAWDVLHTQFGLSLCVSEVL